MNDYLYELAREYYMRCEAYDLAVCTGPITREGVMPRDYREMYFISRHALSVRREIIGRAHGDTEGVHRAMRAYERSGQYMNDMRELLAAVNKPAEEH